MFDGEWLSIRWHIDDVKDRALELGISISTHDAARVLKMIDNTHDCNHGVTWDTISDAILEITGEK